MSIDNRPKFCKECGAPLVQAARKSTRKLYCGNMEDKTSCTYKVNQKRYKREAEKREREKANAKKDNKRMVRNHWAEEAGACSSGFF